MAHYIFNSTSADAADALRAGRWEVGEDEPHRDALAAGDLILVYRAAPERDFIGRAELSSAASGAGVSLTNVEEWDPPVPMDVVLAQIDRSAGARADFEAGVVRITAGEYETAVSSAGSAARRASP